METFKTWMVSDLSGRNIFYFELFKIESDDKLFFDSNISFQLKHKGIIDHIEMLLSNHLPIATRDFIATLLFSQVQKIKCYSKFYFDESVLDKNGKLNMSSYKLIQQLTFEKLRQDGEYNVPISMYSFPDLFREFENYFCTHQQNLMRQSKIISKAKFESYLINDALKNQYVNIYNNSNMFFVHLSEQGYYTYFVMRRNKLQFAFKTQ